jgi:hypothetical protein
LLALLTGLSGGQSVVAREHARSSGDTAAQSSALTMIEVLSQSAHRVSLREYVERPARLSAALANKLPLPHAILLHNACTLRCDRMRE